MSLRPQIGPGMRTVSAVLAAVQPAQLVRGRHYSITAVARDAFGNQLGGFPSFMLSNEFMAALAEPPWVDQPEDGTTIFTYNITRAGDYTIQVRHKCMTRGTCWSGLEACCAPAFAGLQAHG